MASTFLIVGGGADGVEFGTDGVTYTGIGTIVSASRKDTGEILKLKDRKGATFAKIYFDDENQCSFDAIFDDDVTIPDRGDAIDLCGLTGITVDDIEHKWENTKERMLTITGTRNPGLTLA